MVNVLVRKTAAAVLKERRHVNRKNTKGATRLRKGFRKGHVNRLK